MVSIAAVPAPMLWPTRVSANSGCAARASRRAADTSPLIHRALASIPKVRVAKHDAAPVHNMVWLRSGCHAGEHVLRMQQEQCGLQVLEHTKLIWVRTQGMEADLDGLRAAHEEHNALQATIIQEEVARLQDA